MTPSQRTLILADIAVQAGNKIMEVYATDFSARTKADQSPVTLADVEAEKVIVNALRQNWPNIPIIAEEAAAAGNVPEVSNQFFLVDPLDGTKEFLSRNGEFTVNIALIENAKPVAGVVYAPALAQIYVGEDVTGAFEKKSDGTTWKPIHVRKKPSEGLTALASRSHRDAETEAYLAALNVKNIVGAGSSLKFCTIAAGKADIYPRFGRTMEWDTAAGHAVLSAAGGSVMCADGTPLLYGKAHRGYDNPSFVASA